MHYGFRIFKFADQIVDFTLNPSQLVNQTHSLFETKMV